MDADADADSSVIVNCGDGGAPGTLDETFGDGGIVVLPLDGAGLTALAVQPDGKIVAVGKSQTGGQAAFAIVRLMPNGSLDPSFGANGAVERNVAGNKPHLLNAVALQSDGKIVAAGSTRPVVADDFAVLRYLPNGTADSTFGDGGVVLTDFSSVDVANAVAVMADGRILVAGRTAAGDDDMAFARYNSDGTLDVSFGGTGKVVVNFRGTSDDARAVVLLAGGKILATGTSDDGTGTGRLDIAAARLSANGSLDTSFADAGLFLSSFGPSGSQTGNAIAVDALGRGIVAGNYGSGVPDDFGLVRLSTSGNLDPSFGSNGLMTIDLEGRDDDARGVLLQEDGKVLVVGPSLSATPTDARIGVSRHLSDGGLDPSFGSGGKTLTPLPAGFSGTGSATGAALTTCGLLVAGAWTDTGPNNRMGFVRYRR